MFFTEKMTLMQILPFNTQSEAYLG